MNILHKNRSGGFTLIEIIVVIVLIAIIAFVAVPQMSNTVRAKRLYDAVEKLNDDLNYCRDYAISQHTNTLVFFLVAQNRYIMLYADSMGRWRILYDPARNTTGWFRISDDFIGVSLQSVSFIRRFFIFNWWGTPSEGGTVVLTNGINTHTTTVNAETGYVQR